MVDGSDRVIADGSTCVVGDPSMFAAAPQCRATLPMARRPLAQSAPFALDGFGCWSFNHASAGAVRSALRPRSALQKRRQPREEEMSKRPLSIRTAGALVMLAALAVAAPAAAQQPKYKPISVKTPDGLKIAAQEWGNPAGPEILFIHGFSQSSLSWIRQADSALGKEFRIITYDLRGHGNSDKPLEQAMYRESQGWADEVEAIIDAAGLKRPVLVGWSYGGRVVADYLKVHGPGHLAGINYVDAVSKSDPSFFDEGLKVQPLMFSDDLATNIAATRTFLHNCFERQPSQEEFETMLAFNMMVPPRVRANMGGRTLDIDAILVALKLPVLVTHGVKDRLLKVAAAQYTASKIPGAKLSLYEGVGHAPFFEDAERFNAELAAFVRAAN
jgi:pimeloyl-ACP methyl ester carboxylesterase